MRKFRVFATSFLLIAVIASVFPLVDSAWACDRRCYCLGVYHPGTVFYLGKDNITKGDWQNAVGSPIGVYGSYAHILPNPPKKRIEIPVGNFDIPVGGFSYTDYYWTQSQINGLPFNKTDPPYWDEYVSKWPNVTYQLTGSLYYDETIGFIQWPVFEWAWDDFNSSDIRAAHFKTFPPNVTRLTCWDDGSERDNVFPITSPGYFNITMGFPSGVFMLSLYVYDRENGQRDNQTIYITDLNGNILDFATMNGTEFDGGMYVQFIVCGSTTIVVHIKKSPTSINALLSGIFVDKLPCISRWRCCRTMGFWMTNLAKLLGYQRGFYQVRLSDMQNYISFARTRCPTVFGDLNTLQDAYNVFPHYSASMDSMLSKAKAQLLALLFNVASGRAYESDIVGFYLVLRLEDKYPLSPDYPFTVGEAIDNACANIASMSNLEFTKDVCETLNEGYYAKLL